MFAAINAFLTVSSGAPPGQVAYTTAGTYSWTAPAGVTSISVLLISSGAPGIDVGGNGHAGGGGCLGYENNITVTPGNSYTVVVGTAGTYTSFTDSVTRQVLGASSNVGSTTHANVTGYGYGGSGGGSYITTDPYYTGGGGGPDYAATFGGAGNNKYGNVGTGAANGGGGGGFEGGGGGTGLLGQGTSGAAATGGGLQGGGGSGGTGGGATVTGGRYGAGGGSPAGNPGPAAVRIIWPGTTRQFPSTNTGDM